MSLCGLCQGRTRSPRKVKIEANGADGAEPLLEDEVCPTCVDVVGNIVHPAYELAAELGVTPPQALVVRVLLEELEGLLEGPR